MTTILAVQGSPRGKKSNTDIIVQEFLSGARSEGAQTETVYLKDLKINHCTGCYHCWTQTPGECIFKDDMPSLLNRVRRCDILVQATPVYCFTMTSLLKAFQDRMIPLSEPFIVKVGDRYKHPSRYNRSYKTVLISNCGFPDMRQFDALRHTMRMREEFGHTEMIGELLLPAGEMLRQQGLGQKYSKYFEAFFRAGVEVVRNGRIAPETEKIVQNTFISEEDIAATANIMWENAIAHSISYTEARKNSVKLLLRGMAAFFQPEAAGDLQADIQFVVSGKEAGNWYFSISKGVCTFHEGVADNAALTIATPADTWLAISQKKLDGQQALMDGKYTVKGDTDLLLKMSELFNKQ